MSEKMSYDYRSPGQFGSAYSGYGAYPEQKGVFGRLKESLLDLLSNDDEERPISLSQVRAADPTPVAIHVQAVSAAIPQPVPAQPQSQHPYPGAPQVQQQSHAQFYPGGMVQHTAPPQAGYSPQQMGQQQPRWTPPPPQAEGTANPFFQTQQPQDYRFINQRNRD